MGLRCRVPGSAQRLSRLAPTSAGPGAGSAGLRREAAAGGSERSPGSLGRAGAARTGAPRRCRCPGRAGDAAAGDSGRLFGSVRKVTAATRPTLNPPPRRTRGRGKERGGREETGVGARSRSFPGAEPSHSSISRAVAPGCRAGRTSASPALAGAELRPGSAPLPLDSRFDVWYQLQSAETFPFPAALTLIFGLFVW